MRHHSERVLLVVSVAVEAERGSVGKSELKAAQNLRPHPLLTKRKEVLAAGARGYVLKAGAGCQLVDAVQALSRHKPFFTARAPEALLEAFLKSPPQAVEATVLTHREREVVQLLAEGKVNKEVAAALGISVKTVETHRAAVMRKLGINSIVDLVHYAIRNHLVTP